MRTRGTLRLATRGSDLALRQAASVRDALVDRRYEVELVEVETRGDRVPDELIHRLGRTGAFVRALDERVLSGEVDAAVHSLKDMPTESPDGLVVAGVPQRASAGDVLVTPDGIALEDLPDGAVVGTSSLRRRAQLLHRRPDLSVEPLRGNVDTRVAKLLAPALQREHERRIEAAEATGDHPDDGDGPDDDRAPEEWLDGLAEIQRRALDRVVDDEYDAIVLAEAGLRRSGLLDQIATERLPVAEFVPAPGQGTIAVTSLDDGAAETIHDVIDHPRTRIEVTVERTILAELGGGCVAPIGVHAILKGEHVRTTVQVLDTDGRKVVDGVRDLPVVTHAEAAVEFAADLRERGAADLVERAREAARNEVIDDDPTANDPTANDRTDDGRTDDGRTDDDRTDDDRTDDDRTDDDRTDDDPGVDS